MLRAHLKLIAAFLVLGIVAAAAVGMFYAWKNYLEPSWQARQEILELESDPPERIDRGREVFVEAMGFMAQRDISEAHRRLTQVFRTYDDSEAYGEARRIIGEMNMDRLLSDVMTPDKKKYEVAGGDSLIKIANQHSTTLDYLVQVNDLEGTVLQRGEQLVVAPLEFEVNVSLSDATVTLLREGKYFKDYPVRLSRNVRAADTEVESKSAYVGNRLVRFGQEGYVTSEKWITCGKGVIFGPYTRTTREDEDLNGIFLDVADIEELYTVLRHGTVVKVRQ